MVYWDSVRDPNLHDVFQPVIHDHSLHTNNLLNLKLSRLKYSNIVMSSTLPSLLHSSLCIPIRESTMWSINPEGKLVSLDHCTLILSLQAWPEIARVSLLLTACTCHARQLLTACIITTAEYTSIIHLYMCTLQLLSVFAYLCTLFVSYHPPYIYILGVVITSLSVYMWQVWTRHTLRSARRQWREAGSSS